jgi:hypothetical protein
VTQRTVAFPDGGRWKKEDRELYSRERPFFEIYHHRRGSPRSESAGHPRAHPGRSPRSRELKVARLTRQNRKGNGSPSLPISHRIFSKDNHRSLQRDFSHLYHQLMGGMTLRILMIRLPCRSGGKLSFCGLPAFSCQIFGVRSEDRLSLLSK